MKFIEKKQRGARESAARLIKAHEEHPLREGFSVEKDIDPYWNDIVNSLQQSTLPGQLEMVSLLLLFHPERRSQLQQYITDERFDDYAEATQVNASSADNWTSVALINAVDLLRLYPEKREAIQDIWDPVKIKDGITSDLRDTLADAWVLNVQELYASFIFFPELRAEFSLPEIWKQLEQQLKGITAAENFVLDSVRDHTIGLAYHMVLFPQLRTSPTIRAYIEEKYRQCPDIRQRKLWSLYLDYAATMAVFEAEHIRLDEQGLHLEFKKETAQPQPLPSRSLV